MRARSRRVFLGSPRLQPWVAHTASIRPCVLSSSHGLPHDVPYWLPALCVMCRPRLACLSLSHPFRSSVSPLAPLCVSFLCPPIRLLISSCVPCRAYPVGMSVSSHPLIRLSAYPLIRLALLILPVSRVVGRGVHRLALISSCVPPAPACLLAALRSAHHRGAIADVIVSFLRSAAIVPPLPRLALSPRSSCRKAGRCRAARLALVLFLVGFLHGRMLFSSCLCYHICRGDGVIG